MRLKLAPCSLLLLLALPAWSKDQPTVDCVNWSSTFAFRAILPATLPPMVMCVVRANKPNLRGSYALIIDWIDQRGQPHTSVITEVVQGEITVMRLWVDAQSLVDYPKLILSPEPWTPVGAR